MAKLIINPTSGARKEIPVGEKILSIGRDPSNDLVLSDAMVSRRHAIMEYQGDQYTIRDNNSSNGTLVNGDRVVGDQMLRDGDLIAIGSARLLFEAEPGDGESAKPAPPSKPAEAAEGQTGGSTCMSCGLPASPEDRYCRKCGKELPARSQRQVVCGQCSSPVALPADYCGKCGKPLLAQRGKHQVPTRPWVPPVPFELGPKAANPPTPPPPKPARPPHRPDKEGQSVERTPSRRPAASQGKPAGFWIRFAAYFIDNLIISVPIMISVPVMLQSAQGLSTEPNPFVFVLPIAAGGLTLLLAIVYPVYFWSTRGATPGKGLFGLKVVALTGESPIGVGQALMRLVGYFINGFTFGIGFLLIAFSDDKRGLHDRLADTKVVKRR